MLMHGQRPTPVLQSRKEVNRDPSGLSGGDYSVRNDVSARDVTREAIAHPKNILQMRGAWTSLLEDARRCGRSSSLRGFTAPGGFWPGYSGAGCLRDGKKPTVVAPVSTTKDAYLQGFTGATGLEPATSGVTDRSSR